MLFPLDIHTCPKPEWPPYTTAKSSFKVNKIIVKRRECSQGGIYNSSSPGVCASMNSMLVKETSCSGGPEPDCALKEEMQAILQAHLTLSVFCAPGQTQTSKGFVRKTNVFSLVAQTRDFSWRLNKVRRQLVYHPSMILLFENWHPDPGMLDKGHHPLGTIPSPSKRCGTLSPKPEKILSQAQVCCVPAGWVPVPRPDTVFRNRLFYLKATLGKSTVLTQATVWNQ